MKPFAAMLVLGGLFPVMSPVTASAQEPSASSALIESRQAEITRIGDMIYRVHLDDGTWIREQAPVCPVFTHYVFVRYEQNSTRKAPPFLAVIPLGSTPAKSADKPWQGGIILVPQSTARGRDEKPAAEREQTAVLFNRIWSDELEELGHPGIVPNMTWTALSECYARLANEQPLRPVALPENAALHLASLPVSATMVQLHSESPRARWLTIRFDARGMVSSAGISESAVARPAVATIRRTDLPVSRSVPGTISTSALGPGRPVPATVNPHDLGPGKSTPGIIPADKR